jgi:putative ABC transport system permease protein
MLAHYLVTLYRSLTRHRLYAALNVFGLAVGIAVFLVLWLDVRFETSFEKWIPDAKQIYNVRSQWHEPGAPKDDFNSTMGGMLEELRTDYPNVVGTRLWPQPGSIRAGSDIKSETISIVDPNFFRVLALPFVRGNRSTALQRPGDVVLTQTMAQRYFGTEDAVGKRLRVDLMGSTYIFLVTGVIADPPKTTDLPLDFITPITPQLIAGADNWFHWGSEHLQTFLRFTAPDAAAAFARNFPAFVDRHGAKDLIGALAPHQQMSLGLRPLRSIHVGDTKAGPVITGLSVVGFLTLLLAAVNYVNLATARAGLRAREVAVRKVMGATPTALFAQFMAESLALAIVATLIGLALCEVALPLINSAGGLALKLDYFSADGPIPGVALVMLVVGIGAGLYPAVLLTGYRPAQVLASARTPGGGRGGRRVREGLVLFQFAIAIAFAASTAIIFNQLQYLRSADLGFKRDGLVVVTSFDDGQVSHAQQQSLLEAWKGVPGVIADTASNISPGTEDTTNGSNFKRQGQPGDGLNVYYNTVRPDFLKTFGAHLIAGRWLEPARGGDDRPTPPPGGWEPNKARPVRNVVLNESAVRKLGFASPEAAVGQPLLEGLDGGAFTPLNVVGVIADTRLLSPHEPVQAAVFFLTTHEGFSMIATIRYAGVPSAQMISRLHRVWISIAPDAPFRAKTAEDNLARYYRPDDQHGRLFTLGAVLAVLIGCVGLYGLASFNTARRVKEIGIRKTLGASTADVLRLLVGQLLRPVVLANLLAWPLAYLAMRSWLNGFDQRIALSPLYFVGASALMLVVALLTVVGQALAVARAEPAKALRHE